MNDCVGDSEENDDIKVVDEVSGSKTEMDERTLAPVGDISNILFENFLTYFQNICLVAPGFEASKFLHKCDPPLRPIVKCHKLAIYD